MLLLLLARAGQIGGLLFLAVDFVEPVMEQPLPERVLVRGDARDRRSIDALQMSLDPPRWESLRLDMLFVEDAIEPDETTGDDLAGTRMAREGNWSVRSGIGFTADPTTFLLALGADYFVTHDISVGPLLQFGLDDDPFIFAPTAHVQWTFDLADIENLKPYLQAGVGFAYFNEYGRNASEDDIGWLINPGAGFDWYFNERAAAGTSVLLNILPGKVFDDEFFFSWQVLTFRFIF
jgi:hypothetical protein